MTRIAFVLPLLVLAACDRVVAKDVDTLATTLEWVEQDGVGFGLAGFDISAGVNAEARPMKIEIEIGANPVLTEGESVEMVVYHNGGEVGRFTDAYEDSGGSIVFEPAFGACDALGYTLQVGDACSTSLQAVVTGTSSIFMVPDFRIRAIADKDWHGDKDTLDVWIDVQRMELDN